MEHLYKGLLRFLDGTEQIVPIPGAVNREEALYIPESITVDEKFFKLDRKQESDEFFVYTEIANIIPFRPDLH